MRLGRIEILLVLLVVCAAAYMGIQYIPSGGPMLCSPVPLSPEVKAYIDQKLAANAGNPQCGDIPAVLARVSDIESKMGTLAKFDELRTGLDQKRQQVNAAVAATRQSQTEVLAQLRNAELGRLRNEMAMMCAGISIRSSTPGGTPGVTPAPGGARRGQGGARGAGAGRPGAGQRRGGAPGAGAGAGGGAAPAAPDGGATGGAGDAQN